MTFNEAKIEDEFIKRLQDLKYVYRPDIRDRAGLEKNFREKFETLNQVKLTDSEFSRILEIIVSPDVFKSAQTLRERNTFIREDGTPLQYTLVNIKDWCKNEFEVINQLRINTANSHHRYDVMLLINGVPVAQVELKTLEINPRRAMEQIVDYKNDVGNGYANTLLCFIQLFIVSNKNNTYYFANNHKQHFAFNADERFLPIYQMADEENYKITHLHDFTDKFLSKCKLGELISRYMVLVVSEQKLMIMRPYQIYAVKAIVECIKDNRGNGYIWHTTGSGKTLTSFKASTLLKENNDIHKCLFVVDRKDLDRQTREEFNKFQEGCVEQNTNTGALVKRLLSDDHADKVIVTTIQKLGIALSEGKWKDKLQSLSSKRIAIIFDECHRSQFGENHKAIKEFFPKAQLFGFTGTPIFEENATYKQVDGNEATYKTTTDIFEKELHSYTITNAIDDRNVLRFHIDYYKPEIETDAKQKIKPNEAVSKEAVVRTILEKHDKATNNRRFNAVLATSSINDAIDYYYLFTELESEKCKSNESYVPLNIACVFSPPANENQDVKQLQEDLHQERVDNEVDPDKKKEALAIIMDDYNALFGTNHSVNEFDLYYQDIQKRIKDQKYSIQELPKKSKSGHKTRIDIVIVVDMLLTGFDSKYLNTLYVDKNLKYHGLIQAFSRTNRILNDTKPYGNILDFRSQQNVVDDAIKLFSGKRGNQAKEIWLVEPAPKVIEKLEEAVNDLECFIKEHNLPYRPDSAHKLKGDEARAEFLNKFKEVQRLKTQLDQYTDLTEEQKQKIDERVPEEDLRGFRGAYLELAKRFKDQQAKADPESELAQLDFEFVLFSSAIIDYDYIMKLISQYTQGKTKQKMSRDQLIGLLTANSNFMEERDDIIAYINSLKIGEGLTEEEISKGFKKFKDQKMKAEITAIATKHGLHPDTLFKFVESIIDRMIFDGDKLSDLMEPFELGWKDRTKKEEALMEDLIPLFKKLANGREISGLAAYE
ncbi:MAG: type I restriction endonuclease subunit R [Bdellovibrionales bacterium]|nr:type I restriction endonuclease subunit R [Bdellovibrionales bacterium]